MNKITINNGKIELKIDAWRFTEYMFKGFSYGKIKRPWRA